NNKWIDKNSFDVTVAAASISPASLPVSICAVWNLKYSLLSAYAYALPGPLIFLALLTGFGLIGEAGVKLIEYASAGILVFVLLLIFKFVGKNFTRSKKTGGGTRFICVLLASFFLYSGNSLKNFFSLLFGVEKEKIFPNFFSLSMLNLIFMLFFIVCFIGASKSKFKKAAAFLLSAAFAISCCTAKLPEGLSIWLLCAMAISAAVSVLVDAYKNKFNAKKLSINFKPLINIAIFFLVAIGLTAVVFIVTKNTGALEFVFKGVASSLTSFGGGEVYYAIADEVFVQTGLIAEEFYFSRILGIAGAMPGPVIVSILAGVGFAYGSADGGAAHGWLYGMLGISAAVTATALGASLLFTVFDILKESKRLKIIVELIVPLVCGVLISVALTLFARAADVVSSVGLHQYAGFVITAVLFAAMYLLHKKTRANDMVLFAAGGTFTLAALFFAGRFI
ncbi:MAG: chromate transporter, partial [Defluviitaleaceae bacterium]|nr:chromate transporter [Defluviitaleaceae bacterium]